MVVVGPEIAKVPAPVDKVMPVAAEIAVDPPIACRDTFPALDVKIKFV
jgi:hypothetical protein